MAEKEKGILIDSLDLSMLNKSYIDKATIPNQETVVEKTIDPIITEENKIEESQQNADTVIKPDAKELAKETKKVTEILENIIEDTSVKEDETVQENTEPPASSVFPALAKYMKEKELVSLPTDEVKTEEDFVNLMIKEIEDTKYSGLTDNQKMYMQGIEAGIPDEQMRTNVDAISNLESITEEELKENKELRLELIRTDLVEQGWDEDRINKQIDRLVTANEDFDEAMHSRANINAKRKELIDEQTKDAQLAQQDAVKAQEEQLENLKASIYGTNTVLKSVNVDAALQNKVFKLITTPVGKMPDGQPVNALIKDRVENPIEFEKNLYYMYELTNGFKDLNRFVRKAENTAAKELRAAIEVDGTIISGSGAGLFKPNNDQGKKSRIVSV